MHTLRSTAAAAILSLALLPLSAADALAQSPAPEAGAIFSALHPAEHLGSGNLNGFGAELGIGIATRASLHLSAVRYQGAATETGESGRGYDLTVPAATFRLSLIGSGTDLAALFSTGVMHYELDAYHGDVARTATIPTVGVGAAFRTRIVGPIHFEVSAQDWISYPRDNHLGTMPTPERKLVHSIDLRVGLQAILPRREPTPAMFVELPLQHTTDFRPLPARTATDGAEPGRDHVHAADGLPVPAAWEGAQNGGTSTARDSLVARRLLGSVYFAPGSQVVDTAYRSLIEDVATYLATDPNAKLILEGYNDDMGTPSLHFSIAERRGTAVRDILVRLYDADPARIDVVSRGVDYMTSDAALARRVDLVAARRSW